MSSFNAQQSESPPSPASSGRDYPDLLNLLSLAMGFVLASLLFARISGRVGTRAPFVFLTMGLGSLSATIPAAVLLRDRPVGVAS